LAAISDGDNKRDDSNPDPDELGTPCSESARDQTVTNKIIVQ